MLTIPIDDAAVSTTASVPKDKTRKPKRVSVKKPRDGSIGKLSFWTNPNFRQDLQEVRALYRQILGRDVALSVIMRRALRGPREELDVTLYERRTDGETAQLLRHLG
jgi:hypothetical protein